MKSIINIIKSWKFVLIITVLLLYSIYVGVLYNQDIKLPSENWSRGVKMESLKPQYEDDIIMSNNFTTVPNDKKNHFVTLWYHENLLNYNVIYKDGKVLSSNALKLNGVKPEKIQGLLSEDNIVLYSLEEGSLYKYKFNYEENKMISRDIINDYVKDFKAIDDLLFYSRVGSFNILNNNGNEKVVEDINIKTFNIVTEGNTYNIAAHKDEKRESGYLLYFKYNKVDNIIEKFDVADIPFMSTGPVDIGIVKDLINIIVPSYDHKNNRVVAYLYEFPKENPLDINKSFLRINGNPTIIKTERDTLQFIASDTIMKGNKNKTINLVLNTFKNGKKIDEKLLTKTDKVSAMPNYFSLGEDYYLQWIDKSGMKKAILFSSSNETIIENSKHFSLNEWVILIFNTFLSLLSVSFMSAMPLVTIIFPIMIVIILLGSYKIYWMEKNPLKIFLVAFVGHNIAKVFYMKYVLSSKMNTAALPYIFTNPIGIASIVIIGTLISLYCTFNFIKDDINRKHFLLTYVFYGVIDILLLSLTIYPYIYSFMAFGYLTNV